MKVLIDAGGRPLTRHQLLAGVWGAAAAEVMRP